MRSNTIYIYVSYRYSKVCTERNDLKAKKKKNYNYAS